MDSARLLLRKGTPETMNSLAKYESVVEEAMKLPG